MWFQPRAILLFLATIAVVSGCSSNGGFLGTDYHPRGDITLATVSGTALATSSSAPYAASGGFSVVVHETDFSGPYAVRVIKWNNGFDIPCFVPHAIGQATYTFSADNANPPTDPATQANPCHAGDEEVAQISDGDGHAVLFYFELPTTLVGSTATPAPTGTPSGTGTAAPSSCLVDPATGSATITGAAQVIALPCVGDVTSNLSLPANGAVGATLATEASLTQTLGSTPSTSFGTPLVYLSLEPSQTIAFNQGLPVAFTVTSPTLVVPGHTYALQVYSSLSGSIVATYTGLSAVAGTLGFTITPSNGTLAGNAALVIIVYRTS